MLTSVVAVEALHKTDEVAVLGDDGTLLILSFTLAGCEVRNCVSHDCSALTNVGPIPRYACISSSPLSAALTLTVTPSQTLTLPTPSPSF